MSFEHAAPHRLALKHIMSKALSAFHRTFIPLIGSITRTCHATFRHVICPSAAFPPLCPALHSCQSRPVTENRGAASLFRRPPIPIVRPRPSKCSRSVFFERVDSFLAPRTHERLLSCLARWSDGAFIYHYNRHLLIDVDLFAEQPHISSYIPAHIIIAIHHRARTSSTLRTGNRNFSSNHSVDIA
jgi:hypothetical protein